MDDVKNQKVSVIMNCLNGEKYLREAIDSVYAQTYNNWEIVFWDNASTDHSAEIAKSYDGKLKYFRGDETIPLYAARNLALKEATGEFIAFLDCDDLWLPEKLEKQIGLFSNERVGLVFSNTIFLNQQTKREKILFKKIPPTGMVFRRLLEGNFLPLETVILRRACLENFSEFFDSRLHHAGDADLFLRIAFEWEISYVDQPLAVWRMHDNNATWNAYCQLSKELEMMLAKYRSLIPGFDSMYDNEIRKVKALAAYYKALGEWIEGRANNVRRIILPHILNRPKLFAVYLLSVLPYRYYVILLRLMGKHA